MSVIIRAMLVDSIKKESRVRARVVRRPDFLLTV